MPDEKKHWSKVDVPADTDPGTADQIEVYVNGVEQKLGEDYELGENEILFFRPVRKEKKLSGFRWLTIFLGVVGSYKQNDSVDVVSRADGRRSHHVNLPIDVLIEPTEEERGLYVGPYSPGG